MLRESFKAKYYELTDKECPAEPYLEWRGDQLEQGEYRTETLKQVLCMDNLIQEDVAIAFTKDGMLKLKKGHNEIAAPADASALRQRLKVWGHHWCMIAIKYPQRSELATATPHIFDVY